MAPVWGSLLSGSNDDCCNAGALLRLEIKAVQQELAAANSVATHPGRSAATPETGVEDVHVDAVGVIVSSETGVPHFAAWNAICHFLAWHALLAVNTIILECFQAFGCTRGVPTNCHAFHYLRFLA